MRLFTTGSIKKKLIILAGTAFLLSVFSVGAMLITDPRTTAAAASCPQNQFPETNIVYCGLDGPSTADYITSFRAYYDNNSDEQLNNTQHIHTDLQTVYQYGGGTAALVAGMSPSNTFQATSHSDGTITLNSDGRVVGTNMQIAGRWVKSDPTGFTRIVNDVYIRSYKIYFAPTSTVPTLVHINPATGMADFAVWGPCGNLIKFTPAAPPVKFLTCDSLTAQAGTATDTRIDYTFVAKATAKNTAITSYMFDFGDTASQTITTAQTTATTSHTYSLSDVQRSLTATVTVNAAGVTPKTCTAPVNIPAKPVKQVSSLACVQLTAAPQDADKKTYIFTATAQPTNTTIDSYTFVFGDGTSQTVATGNTTADSDVHTYTAGSTHVASVSVKGPLGTFTSAACQKSVTVPAVLAASVTTLPNTGAGGVIGLFGITTLAGGLFHRFVLRRKLSV